MKRHMKKIVIGLVALVVVVFAASFVYAKFINKADKPLSQSDIDKALGTDGSGVPITGTGSFTDPTGDWKIGTGSQVGYRVHETINGVGATANGRTTSITGTLTVAGTGVTKSAFTVDMTRFASDEGRRDSQFNGRIMQVDQFPTATFTLTAPIAFTTMPASGATITASATGDLTLHGVKKSVTFDIQATFKNGRIGVLGNIPVKFSDYGISNPSFATVTTDDHGVLEFVLILDRA